MNKTIRGSAPAVIFFFVLACLTPSGSTQEQQKISKFDRERAEEMLSTVHALLKKNYYDPAIRGVDIDARLRTYDERLKQTQTLGDAMRIVAGFLTGLDDSHTFFLPPSRSYRADYGYRMRMVGDNCFITEVRPGSDAAAKLRPGDQVISLNGYSVNRKDLWQLEYFLSVLAPKPTSEFSLRDPAGKMRTESIMTKYLQKRQIVDLSLADPEIFNLGLEAERNAHLLRQRYEERGDALIWKMPEFNIDEEEIDRMIGRARRHKALILDLRGNPGGRIDTLERMVGSLFDHEVKIASRTGRRGDKAIVSKWHGSRFEGQLIVLVDSGSASAAELLSRVVQLEHRGTVVGDLSSGSVMESYIYPSHMGADVMVFFAASITSADLIMADGKSLEKAGVTPDIVVLPTGADLAAGRDPVLARAAQVAGFSLDAETAGKLFPVEWAPI